MSSGGNEAADVVDPLFGVGDLSRRADRDLSGVVAGGALHSHGDPAAEPALLDQQEQQSEEADPDEQDRHDDRPGRNSLNGKVPFGVTAQCWLTTMSPTVTSTGSFTDCPHAAGWSRAGGGAVGATSIGVTAREGGGSGQMSLMA